VWAAAATCSLAGAEASGHADSISTTPIECGVEIVGRTDPPQASGHLQPPSSLGGA